MEFPNRLLNSMQHDNWIVQIIIVLAITIFARILLEKFLKKLQARFKRTKNIWDDIFVKSIKKPLSFLVFAFGLIFCAEIIHKESSISLFLITSSIKNLVIIGAITWFLIAFIKEAQKSIISKNSKLGIDRTSVDAISNISFILVIVVMGLAALQTLGVKIGGILALGGVGGIAIGFAAQDLLSNFFGGLIIYFDKPFKVDDWIKSPDKDFEGTVVKIGWRQTQILTFDHRPLYVPNSVFSKIVIENPSRMTNRRVYEIVGIRYDDMNKVEKIINDIKEMLTNNKEIDHSQTYSVSLEAFSASSVDLLIRASTITIDLLAFQKVKQDILLKTAKIIENNEAEIAFPTSTIHLNGNISTSVK